MPSRRAVLGLLGAAATGGCAEFGLGCRWGVTVTATPADEVDVRVEDLVPAERAVIQTAIDTGSANATAIRGSPIDDGDIVSLDGTYFEVSIVDETVESIPALRMNMHPRQADEPLGDTPEVDFGDLPPEDRAVLARAIDGPRWRPNKRLSARFRMSDVPMPYPNGTDTSRLATQGPVWVVRDDRYYHVEIAREDTMDRTTYRYTVSRVGTTTAELQAHAVPSDPIQSSALPQDQRAIVAEAIDGGYETCDEAPPAFKALADRLSPDRARQGYVEYEGTVYYLEVSGY